MTKKHTLLASLVIATLAVLFPPWGFRGENFDSFAFVFSRSVPLTEYPTITANIAWHVLGLELVAIALIGAIAYVIAPAAASSCEANAKVDARGAPVNDPYNGKS